MAAKKSTAAKKGKGTEEEAAAPSAPAAVAPVEPVALAPTPSAPVAEVAPEPVAPSGLHRIPRVVKRSDWRVLGVDALGEKLVATQIGRGLLFASARGTPTFVMAEEIFGKKVPPAFTSELPSNEMPELPKDPKLALPDEWERRGWKTKKTKDGCAFWFQIVGKAKSDGGTTHGHAEFKVFIVNPVHGVGMHEVTLSWPDAERTETAKVAGTQTETMDAVGNAVKLPGMDVAVSAAASGSPLVGLKAAVAQHAVCGDVGHSGILDVSDEFTFEK
jgi:hypothetical protein